MTENTHYKAPATELLHALPISPPTEGARCMYQEPELTDHYMQVLMKPLKPSQASRTNSSWRNCSMYQGQSIAFWQRLWVQSKATTHLMRKLLASWRIWYSTLFMAFLSIITISSWGLWPMLHYLRLSWSLMHLGSWDSSGQGLHSTTKLISRIISATCPQLMSSSRNIP